MRAAMLTFGAVLALPAAATGAPVLEVPATVKRGDPFVVRASGGLTPRLFYRATFTERTQGGRSRRQCARNIDRPIRTGTSTTRVYAWRGRVPRTLACTKGGHRFVIPVRPGRYVVVVGHKTGKASWDPNAVTLRTSVTVTG